LANEEVSVDAEIVAALIGPVLTAGLAALAVVFQEWQRRRQSADQPHEVLRQAAEEVAFIDVWLGAYAKVATPDQQRERVPRALADLERSYAAMTASHQAAAIGVRSRTTADLLARILLLRLHRPGAKVLRVFYYIFAVLGFLFTFAGMSGNILGSEDGLGFLILVGMVFTVMSFSPAILCYALTRLADRPRRSLEAASSPQQPFVPPGYAQWPDSSYPGSVPSPPGQVGAGYPPAG
jgi:hypothetical protein